MTQARTWGDATQAAARLTSAQRRLLLLVSRLPLLFVDAIEAIEGLNGPASIYRTLNRLRAAGLVKSLKSAWGPGDPQGYWHLTELGLAAIAIDQGIEVGALARMVPVTEPRLARLVAGLPHLAVIYCLLADVASAGPGQPELLGWERPWRRRYWPLKSRKPVTVQMPAYAAFRWDARQADFFLIYDTGALPIRSYRPALSALADWRDSNGGAMPSVVVWTMTPERSHAWEALMSEVGQRNGGEPLPYVPLVPDGDDDLRLDILDRAQQGGEVVAPQSERASLKHLRTRRAGSRLVIPALARQSAGPGAVSGLASVLGLGRLERAFLDLVAEHPLLSRRQAAMLLSLSDWGAKRLPNELTRWGFLRMLDREELGACDADDLFELTRAGLEVVAAQHGMTLASAVRLKGVTGGGPLDPIGRRRNLIRNLEHTKGVNEVFTHLRGSTFESTVGLTEWQNPQQCSRWPVRPDGYGMYGVNRASHGFFLEFDRGTMSARDYLTKLAAYYDFRDSQRFERYYDGFPTILFVTTDNAAEKRFAGAALAAATGRGSPLPILLTTLWRLTAENNLSGYLGPIWRAPDEDFNQRRCWPPQSGAQRDHQVLSARSQ